MLAITFAVLSFFSISYANVDINITGQRVSAECKKISEQKLFIYSQFGAVCPFYSHAQVMSFLKGHDIIQDSLPDCQMPTNIELGESLSRPIPQGYILLDENISESIETHYDGYGKYSSNSGNTNAATQGVSPGAQGIRINTYRIPGKSGCNSLSASSQFKSDEYTEVITTETFIRTYRKTCTKTTPNIPTSTKQNKISQPSGQKTMRIMILLSVL